KRWAAGILIGAVLATLVAVVLGTVVGCAVVGGWVLQPRAELLTWHTTRGPLIGSQGSYRLTESNTVFVLVTVRTAGTKLYLAPKSAGDMRGAWSKDFVLADAAGHTIRAMGFRPKFSKDFSMAIFNDQPDRTEEIEIAFVADSDFARRPDLVLRY